MWEVIDSYRERVDDPRINITVCVNMPISIPTKSFSCLYKPAQADKSPKSATSCKLNQLGQISHKFGPNFHFLLTSL
jgi:hypothetical protein